jgi:argininosuccinate lyase
MPSSHEGSSEDGAEAPAQSVAEGAALWHGRFADAPAEALMAFTESLSFDRRLLVDDVAASKAHVRGLRRGGLVTEDEMAAILAALDTVEMEFRVGSLRFEPTDEDVHTAIERRVTELAGPAGGKLHTGRSRNDQVATAFRRYLLRELDRIARLVLDLVDRLIERAESEPDTYLPGYTHLQQAQPVMLAHHLYAHCWALLRDVDRLGDCRRRVDVSPLGAGALAGSSLPLSPDETARDAGFSARFENSLDATSDRDFVAESLFCLAMTGIHLSRMGEEIVVWTSEEFGFARLADAFATGSSMMPQKKNPDIAELARGKAGRLIGNLTGLMATLKSLPLAYNRDLQEDKEPVFDSIDQLARALVAFAGLYGSIEFRSDRMRQSADNPLGAATDLAEFLVRQGMPFREAHAVVGAVVRRAVDDGEDLAELVAADPALGAEAAELLSPGVSVRQRTTPGSGGPEAVRAQSDRLAEASAQRRRRLVDMPQGD